MWVMRYLFKVKSSSGAAAVRGNALEFALEKKYTEGEFDYATLEAKFMTLCAESTIALDTKPAQKEMKSLTNFGEVIDKCYQERVEVKLNDLSIPIMGYIDFRFKDKVVDLKTTNRMPSEPTQAQNRQMALYSMAYPSNEIELFFASSKNHKKFKLTNLAEYKKQLEKVAHTIQKFLSISNDKHELASFVYPNTDSWMWGTQMKEEAKKIWN